MMDKSLTLVEHLQELRQRLIISLAFFLIASVVSYFFAPMVLSFLSKPVGNLVFLGPLDALLIRLKLSLFLGFFISSPIIFFQVWKFAEPALKPEEKKYALPFVFLATLLFTFGVGFAYFTFPLALKFLLNFGGETLKPFLVADKYLSFLLMMTFIFGLAFEFPLIFFFLMKFKIISPEAARRNRKYFYLLIFIVSAFITPTQDIFTMTVLGIPLILFYETTLFLYR